MSLALKQARGDPGLFGGIARAVTSVAKYLPGPIGGVASVAHKLVSGTRGSGKYAGQTKTPAQIAAWRARISGQSQPQLPRPGLVAGIQRLVPGGATGTYADVGAPPMPEIGSPKGYRVNQSDYFLKDGTFVPKGSRWVKIRRRNPLNPSAASKAIARIEQLKRATERFKRVTIKKRRAKT